MEKNSIKEKVKASQGVISAPNIFTMRTFIYSLASSKEGGRMILTNNPAPVCYKCGAPLKAGSRVFFCHLNKKVYCDTPKCKVKACALERTQEEHEDTYDVLKIQPDGVKK